MINSFYIVIVIIINEIATKKSSLQHFYTINKNFKVLLLMFQIINFKINYEYIFTKIVKIKF